MITISDCIELSVPRRAPISRPGVEPRPPTLVRVHRFRIKRPLTLRSDIIWACPVEPPAEYITVVTIASPGRVDLRAMAQMPAPTPRHRPHVVFPVGSDPERWLTAAPVPEPSTWAVMIVGFGLVGVGLRRRRTISAGSVS